MDKGIILVTGAAGFIGSTLVDKLLDSGHIVIGIDDFNDYYSPRIKEGNIKKALQNENFKLYREDILNFDEVNKIFKKEKPDIVIHLAARAGVRPSIDNPKLYAEVNVLGTVNLLKLSVDYKIKKFIFGSSSSVYGNSPKIPFDENDNCQNIISPYGASKRAAEFFVESFSHTFGLKSQVLRFFTVYGPKGRVDMAPSLFTKAIIEGKEINQFGNGLSSRDYTYVDDIVGGIVKTIEKDLSFEIINLGNNHPVTLAEFILAIEKGSGKKAKINKMPLQAGDVLITWADITKAKKLLGWKPKILLLFGLENFIRWKTAKSSEQ